MVLARSFVVSLFAWSLCAQTQPRVLRFETSSVHAANLDFIQALRSGRVSRQIDDKRIAFSATSLSVVIYLAFHVPSRDVQNAPAWLGSSLFDIQATLPAGATQDQVPAMLQSLLADRFGLTYHRGKISRPVYALVRGDGPLKVKQAELNPSPYKCNVESGHRVCRGITMEEVAETLSVGAGVGPATPDREVVDETGIDGAFDLNLDFGRLGPGDLPSAFDAVQAIGLQLRPVTRVYETIIIDHIDKTPTEN